MLLPGSPDLGWNFGFEKGTAFACMSETMMLALEGRYEHMSIGADLSLEHLELMRGLAKKLGFTLAGFRAFDRPLIQLCGSGCGPCGKRDSLKRMEYNKSRGSARFFLPRGIGADLQNS